MTSSFWNERYSEQEFVYGTEPNTFLKEQLATLMAGKILFPCEGEGRNAVFAAQQGWQVNAFDQSEEGFKKAQQLARQNNVEVHYQIADALAVEYPKESFDVIALIYAHFPSTIRQEVHQKMVSWLKPGGCIILEAFNPTQLKNSSGGPKDITMLLTMEILEENFKGLTIEALAYETIILQEGKFHQGEAEVVRFVGRKK
jgi:2-polyprenyl-3-methyl-5-hydroxy-6-metoxy-1,4-benzoquinol methylase